MKLLVMDKNRGRELQQTYSNTSEAMASAPTLSAPATEPRNPIPGSRQLFVNQMMNPSTINSVIITDLQSMKGFEQNDYITKPVQSTSGTRNPKCQKCRNHGEHEPVKNHKRYCKYKNCKCPDCRLIIKKRKITAAQQALRRQQEQDEKLGKTSNTEYVDEQNFSDDSESQEDVYVKFNSSSSTPPPINSNQRNSSKSSPSNMSENKYKTEYKSTPDNTRNNSKIIEESNLIWEMLYQDLTQERIGRSGIIALLHKNGFDETIRLLKDANKMFTITPLNGISPTPPASNNSNTSSQSPPQTPMESRSQLGIPLMNPWTPARNSTMGSTMHMPLFGQYANTLPMPIPCYYEKELHNRYGFHPGMIHPGDLVKSQFDQVLDLAKRQSNTNSVSKRTSHNICMSVRSRSVSPNPDL